MDTMAEEIALIAGSTVVGAISAALLNRLAKSRTASQDELVEKGLESKLKSHRYAKAEIISLQFEKSIVSEGITRVYEAFHLGKVDRLERDRLLLKYKQQLDSLNQKILEVQPVSDVVELAEVRDSLVSLVEERIAIIDHRLAELSEKSDSDSSREVLGEKQPRKESTVFSSDGDKVIERKKYPRVPSEEEKSVEQLQKEITDALFTLEQVEIDKD